MDKLTNKPFNFPFSFPKEAGQQQSDNGKLSPHLILSETPSSITQSDAGSFNSGDYFSSSNLCIYSTHPDGTLQQQTNPTPLKSSHLNHDHYQHDQQPQKHHQHHDHRNSVKESTHRRGTNSSQFNSDSTLVDHLTLPSKIPSNKTDLSSNSECQTLASVVIEEEQTDSEIIEAIDESISSATLDSTSEFPINTHNTGNQLHNSKNDRNPSISSISLSPIRTSHSVPITATTSSASSLTSNVGSESGSAPMATPASSDYSNLASSHNSNRGLLNRSMMHGLGHRSSKSESFNLKLPKKPGNKKSLVQLNQLQEETGKEGDVVHEQQEQQEEVDSIKSSPARMRIPPNPRTRLQSLPLGTAPSPAPVPAPADSFNDSDCNFDATMNTNMNTNTNTNTQFQNGDYSSSDSNSSLSLSLTNNQLLDRNGFFGTLPSAPVDSKHNFTFLNNPSNLVNPSPKSTEFSFNNFRKLNSPLTPSFKFTNTSSDALPSRNSNKNKSNKLKIPEQVKLLKLEEAESYVTRMNNSIGLDGLSNLLIIDVRPFHDYCKRHMSHAINVCLPSTLLKRPTFNLQKCIQTLTSREKTIFEKYSERDPADLPSVLFYDDFSSSEENISPSIFHLAGKFLQNPVCNSDLFILEGGFSKFVGTIHSVADTINEKKNINMGNRGTTSPSLSSSDSTTTPHRTTHHINNVMLNVDNDLSSLSLSPSPFSPPNATISPHSMISPESCAEGAHLLNNNLTPDISTNLNAPGKTNKLLSLDSRSPVGLSRFTLPDVSHIPIFKTRNYDEILTNRPDSTIHLTSALNASDTSRLPKWLANVIGDDLGSSKLTSNFNNLQMQERARLNNALKKTHSNDGKSIFENPVISSGVELGRKNRYKDIFLFEHSRVKLLTQDDSNDAIENDPSNYINASHIHYDKSALNYIATQGPLDETVGDFWKVVYDNNVPIVFSLTPQTENQVEKCAPFWIPGIFQSNGISIEVDLVEYVEDLPLSSGGNKCVARRFFVKIGELEPVKEVLQIHMTSWPDFGIVVCEEDILSMISIKRYIYSKLHIENLPAIVHCSAGCGRTGSFCVIDTCIDVLLNNEAGAVNLNDMIDVNGNVNEDLIYDITSVFRSQRVFMVQTLRQYMLIYDSIITFLKMHWRLQNADNLNEDGLIDWVVKDPGILSHFIESYR
jgi:protein tyrosine phosphatase